MRQDVSTLLAAGHRDAGDYTVARLRDEAAIVDAREGRRFAMMGVVVQSATMTTGMAASEDALRHFSKLVDRLNGD